MCGITGYVDLNSPIEKEHILKMLSCIKHRGPDDTGTHFDKHAALGIQRLSIIDLAGGHQPISNEDKNSWVVFNGEIYNYIELRKKLIRKHIFKTKTDTEVLIHLYEEYGEDFPKYLNGMFAFAIWDKKKCRLILGRDSVGIKPLYFYQQGGKLIFGSELKTILKYPGFRRKINLQALELYKFLGYIPQPFSIFENIYKLPAGEILIFSATGKRMKKFWDIGNLKLNKNSNLDHLLEDSIKLQSRSDVPIGVFLSGGIDSSSIAYYLSQLKKERIKTFSISFEEKTFDETQYFDKVAAFLNTDHHIESFRVNDAIELFPKIIEQLDEPLADPSLFPTYKLCAFARQHVKVVLSGDGGDELFGGYPTYQGHILANLLKSVPPQILKHAISLLQRVPISFNNYPLIETLLTLLSGVDLPLYKRHLVWMSINKSESFENVWSDSLSADLSKSSFNWQTKLQILDFLTYLTDDLLVKTDRASMYNSLEVRVPFLDPNIINFAFSKNQQHFDIFKTKKLLRKLMQDRLPNEIIRRKKKGFGIPLSSWIHGPMLNLIKDNLSNADLYDYFDKKEVLESFKKHKDKKANFGRRLWMLAIFSAWLKNWKVN